MEENPIEQSQTEEMPVSPPDEGVTEKSEPASKPNRWLWQGKIGPAFWTIASLISLSINIFLIVLLILMGRQLFALKGLVADQLVAGLYENFVLMDRAHIKTTIQVQDEIPVRFDLPVKTETTVVLTEDTRLRGVSINLRTGSLSITNAPANIVLPAGSRLPIALDIMVPVSNTVPINLTVPVDIALNQTELHQPFTGLQKVLVPYQDLLTSIPDSWEETRLCELMGGKLCALIFSTR